MCSLVMEKEKSSAGVNKILYGTGSTDYGTRTELTLLAPVHAFGFAPGSGTEALPPPP